MKNISPCPYCSGEVELVKLERKKGKDLFRIQCLVCRQYVSKGTKFPIETDKEGEQRIKEYEKELKRIYSPNTSTKIQQTDHAKKRDWIAANPYLYEEEDEAKEIHDIKHQICPRLY